MLNTLAGGIVVPGGSKSLKLDTLDNFVFDIAGCTNENNRDPDILPFMVNILMYNVPFAVDSGGGLYCYFNGKYHLNGEAFVNRLAARLFTQLGVWSRYKHRKGIELSNLITCRAKEIQIEPDLDKITLLNGVYHIDRGEFLPHDPSYCTTTQIPINYDPDATCPEWDKFLSEILPYTGGPEYLRDIVALCMIPLTSIQKCIVLFGEGSNGKSVFLSALQSAIGNDNISNMSLQSLTGTAARFNNVELLGKLVNIFADLPVSKIIDASNLKGLTGEDRLPMERKNHQPFFAVPFCRLIFSCNNKVDSEDQSDGYKRRFINVPFTQTFESNPKKASELATNLSSPEELSGLFNQLISRFPVIIEDGLIPSQQLSEIIENYAPIPKEYKTWLLDNITVDPNSALPASAFYAKFSSTCTGYGSHSPQKTVGYLKSLFPGIEMSVLTRFPPTSTYVRAFRGIRMSNPLAQQQLISYSSKYTDDIEKIS